MKLEKLIRSQSSLINEATVQDILRQISLGQLGIVSAETAKEIVEELSSGKRGQVKRHHMDEHSEVALVQPIVVLMVDRRWNDHFVTRLVETERIRKKPGKRHSHEKLQFNEGVAKKLLNQNESPIDAARRCFHEKLGLRNYEPEMEIGGELSVTCSFNPNFGKIPVMVVKHSVRCFMSDEFFNPVGRIITRTKPSGEKVRSIYKWLPLGSISN